MVLDQETLRFIFGLKLKTLRQNKSFSLKQLGQLSGLSPSYINEIEKGKKYPKSEKILRLAQALNVTYDDLISLKLDNELQVFSNIIKRSFFQGLPLNAFGIPARTLLELMSEKPHEFSAILGALLEVARTHQIGVQEFYQASLRAYLDMHDNFFPEIENAVSEFCQSLHLVKKDGSLDRFLQLPVLIEFLQKHLNYKVLLTDFSKYPRDLHGLHYFITPLPSAQNSGHSRSGNYKNQGASRSSGSPSYSAKSALTNNSEAPLFSAALSKVHFVPENQNIQKMEDEALENQEQLTSSIQKNEIASPIKNSNFSSTSNTTSSTPIHLFLNDRLSEKEKVFILCREIAHSRYKHQERIGTSKLVPLTSFNQLYNNFRASYFASSLLFPRQDFAADIQRLFQMEKWDAFYFAQLAQSYPGTIENFFHRLAQILPATFGLDQIFFLRSHWNTQTNKMYLVKELHLSELHSPHQVKAQEHYCRRWITSYLLGQLVESGSSFLAGAQFSTYHEANKSYLCLSMAFSMELEPHIKACITLGILESDTLYEQLKFARDPAVTRRVVSTTCEYCGISDCQERVAPATARDFQQEPHRIQSAIEEVRSQVFNI